MDNQLTDAELVQFELKNDILFCKYISSEPITLATAEEIVRQTKKVLNGKKAYLIAEFPKLNHVEREAREHFASDEANEGILASALVTDTLIGKVIANFFLRLNYKRNPHIPSKVFNSEQDAIEWIQKLKVN